MEVNFKFSIGQEIKILENSLIGKIVGLWFGNDEIKRCLVEYTDKNGLIAEKYRKENEIVEL